MNPPILIAGATGSTGRVATKLLLEKGLPVRALVHKEDDRSAQLKTQGAEIVVGDLLDFNAVRRAFAGAKRGYFVYPIRPGIVQASAHFAQAAIEAKAEAVVNMSQRTARPDSKSGSALQHWLAERVFDWAGTPVTHLRPTVFNEWLLYMRGQIRDGHYKVPFAPTMRFAPISAEDQGAVIAAILADPEPHQGQTYQLFGPVEVTPPEIAEIVGQVLGKPVRYERISGKQWVLNLYGQDVPFLSQHIQEAAGSDPAEAQFAGMNDLVEKIGGSRPMTVAEFVEKHRAAFQ
jgi:NAD(P)H dehydrogenase (quinone)